MIRSSIRWFHLLPLLLLSACLDWFEKASPPPIPLETIVIRQASLEDFAHLAKAVKLEAREESLLGDIHALKLDPRNGDMLLADMRATKALYRFDQDGKFLRRYGRHGQGPGEYEKLLAFDLLDDGRVLLVGFHQIMLFAEDGRLLQFRDNRWSIHWMESSGRRIFAYTSGGLQKEERAVLVFDDQLELIHKFHTMDPRVERVTLVPYDGMALADNHLYVAELYDFQVTRYNLEGKALGSYHFPNFNRDIAAFFHGKGSLTDHEVLKLSQSLHNARRIDAFGNYLSILEANPKRGIMDNLLLNLETNKLYRFEGLRFVEARAEQPHVTVDRIVGAFPGGLIATLEDTERFDRIQQLYPALADLSFVETDNPLLLFFEVKPR